MDRDPTGRHPDLAAVLPSGGKSRRMGRDKALLRLGGQPFVQLLAARLLEFTDWVLLSADEPSACSSLGLPAVADLFPGCDPIAGVHAALRQSARSMMLRWPAICRESPRGCSEASSSVRQDSMLSYPRHPMAGFIRLAPSIRTLVFRSLRRNSVQ